MKFRKKPVVIEAEQYWKRVVGPHDNPFHTVCYCDKGRGSYPRNDRQHIHTLEGPLHVTDGDWIIKGVAGEFYPCKPDIFEQTYGPASVPVLETPPETIFCDHSRWREAEDQLQAIKEMLAVGGHTAAYDLRRDINDILIGFSAPVEPVPAPTLDSVKTLLREFKAEGTYEFKAETAPEAFLQQEIKSLLADLDEALSAPVPAPRLECDHTTEFYDEAGDATRVLWSEDVIGYNYCPYCGTLLLAPPVGTQE